MLPISDLTEAFEERRSRSRYLKHSPSALGELVDQFWDDPLRLESSGTELRYSRFRRTVQFEFGGERFVMKHYREPRTFHALKRSLLQTRALYSWNAALRLLSLGIATPRPVLCLENRFGPFRRDSFLVYTYLEGSTLRETIVSRTKAGEGAALDDLWQQLGRLWEVFRTYGVSLSDANTGNFIVTPAGQIAVIDVDGTRFHKLESMARRCQRASWQKLSECAALYAASAEASVPTGAPNSQQKAA